MFRDCEGPDGFPVTFPQRTVSFRQSRSKHYLTGCAGRNGEAIGIAGKYTSFLLPEV